MSCTNCVPTEDEDLTLWRHFFEVMNNMMDYHKYNIPEGMVLFSNIKDGEDLHAFRKASEDTGVEFKLTRPAFSPTGKWLHSYRAMFINAKNEGEWIAFAVAMNNHR